MKDRRLYLVAEPRIRAGPLVEQLPALIGAGVDVVQLRHKTMEAGDLIRWGTPLAAVCHEMDTPFIVNDRPDVALALGADGVHLGQNDVPVDVARRLYPQGIVGWSTHTPEEVDAARTMTGIDYFAVGPVNETPTKPGRPAVGLDLIRHAAGERQERPWFAIGGINESNLSDVLHAGARRIVVVRAVTEAGDPVAAVTQLRNTLDEVAL